MSDDLERTGPEDPNKINVNQSWEVTYWCKILGVTEKELREAVEAVGSLVADVKAHIAVLRQRRRSKPRMGM